MDRLGMHDDGMDSSIWKQKTGMGESALECEKMGNFIKNWMWEKVEEVMTLRLSVCIILAYGTKRKI